MNSDVVHGSYFGTAIAQYGLYGVAPFQRRALCSSIIGAMQEGFLLSTIIDLRADLQDANLGVQEEAIRKRSLDV